MQVIVIGRDADCSVVLQDSRVSRHHAQIVNDGSQITICDLNSTNGTFVNGQRISSQVILKQNDLVNLGGVAFPWTQYVNMPQSSGTGNVVGPGNKKNLLWLWILLAVLGASIIGVGAFLIIKHINKDKTIIEVTTNPEETPEAEETPSTVDLLKRQHYLDSIKNAEMMEEQKRINEEKIKEAEEISNNQQKKLQDEQKKAENEAGKAKDELEQTKNLRVKYNLFLEQLDQDAEGEAKWETICKNLNVSNSSAIKFEFEEADLKRQKEIVDEMAKVINN